MRRRIAVLLLLSFIAVGVFGLIAMGMGSEHEHSGCIAATASQTACPASEDSGSVIAFHLEAFKSFSQTTSGSLLTVLAQAVLLCLWGALSALREREPALAWLASACTFLLFHSLRERYRRLHFLALLEHSPALV